MVITLSNLMNTWLSTALYTNTALKTKSVTINILKHIHEADYDNYITINCRVQNNACMI